MAMQRERVTVEDFQHLIANAEKTNQRLELINGEIIEKMPTVLHAVIVYLLTRAFVAYLNENPIGWAVSEVRYGLPGDNENSLIPDLSFIRDEPGALIRKGAAPYMPELAIEVQSPGQSDKFMIEKASYYLRSGTKIVWIVYAEKQIVEVLTPSERHLLTINDTLTGGDVLPGFSVLIREIFPKAE